MATITPLLRTAHKSKDGTFPIVVCIRHGKDTRLIPVGKKVEEAYWQDGKVSKKHPEHLFINSKIADVVQEANDYLNDCARYKRAVNLWHIGVMQDQASFTDYIRKREQHYRAKKMVNMYQKAERTIKELTECFGGDVLFSDLTQDALRKFEEYLIKLPNSANTRFKKFEHLQKYFTGGVNEGLTSLPNPFKLYHIQTTPVKKEKLTLEEFKALEEVPLKPGPVALARDLFLFSYYCKGARVETCITMTKAARVNGRLYFQTNKGKKFLSAQLHPKLNAIVERYIDNETPYVFPVIKDELPERNEAGEFKTDKDAERYKKIMDKSNTTINRGLEIASTLAGIEKHVTMHIARHTFAFHLKRVTTSIGAITDALGQSSAAQTEKYLKALDDEFLDSELDKLYNPGL